MGKFLQHRRLLPLAALGLAGCATFSSTGPTASALARQAVRLETVTPDAATAMAAQQAGVEQGQVADVLARLDRDRASVDVRLYPGATLNVALWIQPIADGLAGVGTVAKNDLGAFTVANDGTLTLPYAGTVAVAGKDPREAERVLAERFAATRKFQAPQVTLTLEDNASQQIIVAGAAARPTTLAWREGGVTLAEAITRAGGSVPDGQGQMQDSALIANRVRIVRKGATYDLPVRAALEAQVALRPNDQIVLEHRPLVRVQCLGGGWAQNTVQSFDDAPTLSKVVAAGGGLNAQTAQASAVFVLSADRSVIYQFPWNKLSGLQAAQAFPVQDGDIVYVATAPIVRIQQITNILFSAAYPVATARGL
jgi:polysaccharide export outer membrane protein